MLSEENEKKVWKEFDRILKEWIWNENTHFSFHSTEYTSTLENYRIRERERDRGFHNVVYALYINLYSIILNCYKTPIVSIKFYSFI